MRAQPSATFALLGAIALALTACSVGSSPSAGLPGAPQSRSGSSSPIQHVVLVVQENRTFNDFFATYPGSDGTATGWAEANPYCSPPIPHRMKIALTKSNLLVPTDMNHSYKTGYSVAFDGGKMDGYDLIRYGGTGPYECTYPYQYTDPSQIQPYWDMAQQYTLAEHMFTTQGSDSFTAHQDIIAGATVVKTGEAMVDLPGCSGCYWGCDAPPATRTHLITRDNAYLHRLGPFPCTTKFSVPYPTLRDLLDAKGVSWKYYLPPPSTNFGKLLNAYDVVWAVRNGSEWGTNVNWPETNIFGDISNGTLPAVSWVIPEENNSDHPGTSADDGPQWVASVVNAIGESSYWSSTAIVIVWDDWGGLYDNLGKLSKKYGYGGLGTRVPAIVISPYARAGYISKTHYEFGSVLKYVEQNWDLGSLHTSDQRATSLIDCFDYSQSPIEFKQIPSSYDKRHFLREQHPPGVLEAD